MLTCLPSSFKAPFHSLQHHYHSGYSSPSHLHENLNLHPGSHVLHSCQGLPPQTHSSGHVSFRIYRNEFNYSGFEKPHMTQKGIETREQLTQSLFSFEWSEIMVKSVSHVSCLSSLGINIPGSVSKIHIQYRIKIQSIVCQKYNKTRHLLVCRKYFWKIDSIVFRKYWKKLNSIVCRKYRKKGRCIVSRKYWKIAYYCMSKISEQIV